MNGDAELDQARIEAAQRTPIRLNEATIEALKAEAAEIFEQLPEPPAYRRVADPTRVRAGEIRDRAIALLVRCLSSGEAGGDGRLGPLCRSLEADIRATSAMAAGDISSGEALWREARDAQRSTTALGLLWRTASSPPPAKVYDRSSGESRYDPRPEPVVTVQLVCPNACRKVGVYRISPRYATNGLVCSTCHQPFTVYLAEARSVEASPRRSALHYTLKLDEPSGVDRRIEFDDASGADLALTPRDAVAFLYGRNGSLDAVMNLSTGRVTFLVSPGACFIASAVYGELAPETLAFRRFRDQRLLPNFPGRVAVALYVRLSPPLARRVRRSSRLRAAARFALDSLARRIG
jgi:hypothetical protein